MLQMENRSEFWLEQLKIELNFLGSAFLFVKIKLRLSKSCVLNYRQLNPMWVTVDFLFIQCDSESSVVANTAFAQMGAPALASCTSVPLLT